MIPDGRGPVSERASQGRAAPGFDGAILDVDGVLTRTATVHEASWARLFHEVLQARGDARPFTHEEYLAHIDGKPRLDGLRDFLATRGIRLPTADERKLAERKNQIFLELLDETGVEVFDDAVGAVRSWRRQGLGIAFVSASRNAGRVLRAAGIDALCDVRVDGETAERMGLRGKQALFLQGARWLDIEPVRAFVVEDAVAGVEAAAAAHFGMVVGIARGDSTGEVARALAARGATRVVARLDELDEVIAPGERAARTSRPLWTFRFEDWHPRQEPVREALCTLGNGKFATRGAAEESVADGIHYPGTYVAGGYDRIATEIQGEVLVSENLVNWPNWTRLSFRPRGGEWMSLPLFEVLDHEQELDFLCGLLRRRVRVRDRAGRETVLASRRLVSMDDAAMAAIEWELTPLNWGGPIEIRSALDGGVVNQGVARYRQLRGEHHVPEACGADGELTWLSVHTRQSRVRMAQAARTRITSGGGQATHRRGDGAADRAEHRIDAEVEPGRPLRLEKIAAVHTSRDPAISEPLEDARERARSAPDFAELAARHATRWAELWRRSDIRLGPGREEENRILRLHIFHVLQVVSPHIIHRDVGVPARGLHGEAYRGHVFWDELFIFPVLNLQIPALTRELLMYRYVRLGAARAIARSLGCEGAAFPWQSGSSGREESQIFHLNPRSGRWVPDETLRQRHISAAVAWNVWQYVEVTDDCEFLACYGAEMLLEIARFWASFAEWDDGLERYRIRQVVGPDEFHTRYPDTDRPGIDDNAYTNVLASWCLRTAERALAKLEDERRRELLVHLGITDRDRRRWHEVARRLRVVFQDGHIISQFDGYAGLEELDWDRYLARYGDIHRLDRILEAEGDTPNRYKASKQGDVLMLLFLFKDEALIEQLAYMGYEMRSEWLRDNIDYYLHRTSHGSTLSDTLHSWVLASHDRAHSWRLFQQALRADVDDVQGGTTPEGIHLGAMAGTIDLAQRGYTGAVVRDGILWLDPQLPDEMPELCLRLRFRNAWIDLTIEHDELYLEMVSGEREVSRVAVRGQVFELERGKRRRVSLA